MLAGFVTLEGIDGSGKSTVARRLADALAAKGAKLYLTREPTQSWLGDAIRRAYHDDVGPLAEAFLFLADRAAHQEEIRTHLAAGELVLCDRYADSTYAYQGARLQGIVDDPLEFLRAISEPWLRVPDLTILLRLPAAQGLARIAARPNLIRFEDRAFLEKVAANYERLAKARRFAVVDATRPVDDVVAESVALVEKRLPTRNKA